MTRARGWSVVFGAIVVVALAIYVRDPPWAGGITSGLRSWEWDQSGTPFRWTTGRASLFVASDARSITLPMRAIFPGPNGQSTIVRVSVDGRWVADVELPDPSRWVPTLLPLSRQTSRHFRRVDLHVNRVVGFPLLGVQIGVIATGG